MRLGTHLGIGKGPESQIAICQERGYRAYQTFTHAPSRYQSSPIPSSKMCHLGQLCLDYDIRVVIHGSYLVNLCWDKDSEKGVKNISEFRNEIVNAYHAGDACMGAIVHMGKRVTSWPTDQEAIDAYRDNLIYLIQETEDMPGTIILETGAGVGTEIMSSIEELARMYRSIPKQYRARIRFCIDTCHIWAAGYEIGSRSGAREYLDTWNRLIGLNKIAVIHFNNSQNCCGAKVDRHANLMCGQIDPRGLRVFARRARKHHIPLVTETPSDPELDRIEMELMECWTGMRA